LIERDGQLLLARSARFKTGVFSAVAGFVEIGESLEEAAVREVREEVGVTVGDLRYFASQPWPFGKSLMVGYFARHLSGDIVVDGTEIVEAAWFSLDRLPLLPPGDQHRAQADRAFYREPRLSYTLAMRLRFALVLALGLVGGVAGCSKSAPDPGKEVKIADVCSEPDASRVRLVGFLRYRRGLMSFCSSYGGHKTCDLELHEGGERPADFDIMKPRTGAEPVATKLSVPVGDGPGEMDDLPKKFKDSDIRLHLKSGANATEGSHIVIDGKLSVIPGDPKAPSAPKSCYVTVEWVSAS